MGDSRANKPDTSADLLLRNCLLAPEKTNFIMLAGAGSGKTTSLVKALTTIINTHGKSLQQLRQKVACITYTEIAAKEIWADVGNNSLVHVSTIHSFLWSITRTFQQDIREWVLCRIDERVSELKANAAGFGPKVQQRTKDANRHNIERLEASIEPASKISVFSYGTGSNYSKGILGHDDIIRIATDFLIHRPLFRVLLAQQFPYVFVDESQDTQPSVIEGLTAVTEQLSGRFCLGFFGDPMQRIFPTGGGNINAKDGWLEIAKPENFRCSSEVLAVANAIRRTGDSLVQTGGRTIEQDGSRVPVKGSARIFVLRADNRRDELVQKVRDFIAKKNDDLLWKSSLGADVKMLVIVHRMAAARLGFGELYAAMNDKAPEKFSNGFLDGSAWPLYPFIVFVFPILEAIKNQKEFEVMDLLRKHSPLLTKDSLTGREVAESLSKLRASTERLYDLVNNDEASTIREVLNHLSEHKLFSLDLKILFHIDDSSQSDDKVVTENNDSIQEEEKEDEEEDKSEIALEIAAMDAFLKCPVRQFIGYRSYIQQESPFSTQQGVKGAEFERVLVVLDDDEGTHVQFSYDKYFGIKELTANDLKNIKDGKETSIDRTRRLFYVCCTRALSDLVVVYFSTNPERAELNVRDSKIFRDDEIFNEASLISMTQKTE